MYKELSKALAGTREDFATVCKLHGVDPEWTDPKLLEVVMCDECGMWEQPKRAHILADGTVFCRVCHELEDIRF